MILYIPVFDHQDCIDVFAHMIAFWCQVFIILCFHYHNLVLFNLSFQAVAMILSMISIVVFHNWKSPKENYRYFCLWILKWLKMTFPDKRGNTYDLQVKSSWLPIFNIYFWLRFFLKKQRHYFANKGPSSQSYGFSSSHIWMWELDYKESWALKNWCFWTVYWRREPLGLQGD